MQILYFLIFVCSSSDNTASDTRTLHHPPRLGVGETNEKKDESSQQESPKWAAIRSLRGVLGPNFRAVQLFIIVSVKQILSEFYVHVNNLIISRPYIHDCYSFVPLGSLDRKSQNLHVAVTSHYYIYISTDLSNSKESKTSPSCPCRVDFLFSLCILPKVLMLLNLVFSVFYGVESNTRFPYVTMTVIF